MTILAVSTMATTAPTTPPATCPATSGFDCSVKNETYLRAELKKNVFPIDKCRVRFTL